MDPSDILFRLAAALSIGLLVGIERGWRSRDAAEETRVAGLRTFTLIGLYGGVSALLGEAFGGFAFAALALVFAIAWLVFKLWDLVVEGDPSITGLVAGLIVFALGALAVVGPTEPALAAGVALTAVLAFKKGLHAWLQTLSWPELRAALLILAASLVVLPLLPDRAFGPFNAFNPRELWILTIVLAGLSFTGHVGVRLFGARKGLMAAGLAGAMVSSTAVTVDMARRSRSGAAGAGLAAAVAAAANAVMFARILALLALFGPAALPLAGPALGAASAAGALFAALYWIGAGQARAGDGEGAPPVDLKFVLQVAALLAVITIAARVSSGLFGEAALIPTAVIAGFADVDAVTLAVAGLARDGLSPAIAGLAALGAAIAASVSKAALGAGFGARGFAVRHLASTAAMLAVGGAALGVTLAA